MIRSIERQPLKKHKPKQKKVTCILLKNKDKFHKRVVLCLCSYFSFSELAKYAQISKLFYEISGHKKVLKLYSATRSDDYEIIPFKGKPIECLGIRS